MKTIIRAMLFAAAAVSPAAAQEFVHMIIASQMHLYETATSERPIASVRGGDLLTDLRIYERRAARLRVFVSDDVGGGKEYWVDEAQVGVRKPGGAASGKIRNTGGQRNVKSIQRF